MTRLFGRHAFQLYICTALAHLAGASWLALHRSARRTSRRNDRMLARSGSCVEQTNTQVSNCHALTQKIAVYGKSAGLKLWVTLTARSARMFRIAATSKASPSPWSCSGFHRRGTILELFLGQARSLNTHHCGSLRYHDSTYVFVRVS